MNAKYLPVKLGLVVLLIALALGIWLFSGVKLGIDLRGGTSMIFALQTSEGESTSSDLPSQVISVLKKRIDPRGLYSLEWRPLKGNRFEVRMPAPRKETQEAKLAYQNALVDLEKTNIQSSSIRSVLDATGEDRKKAIDAIAGPNAQVKEKLAALADINDRINKDLAAIDKASKDLQSGRLTEAQAKEANDALTKAQNDLDDARLAYGDAQDALMRENISLAAVQATLRLYVSPAERENMAKTEFNQRMQKFNDGLKALQEKAKARGHEKELDEVVARYEAWTRTRQLLDDPMDLKRQIAGTGVLEFRIAPQDPRRPGAEQIPPANGGPPPLPELDRYIKELQENGPEAARRRNDPYEWFPIRGETEGFGSLIVAHWAGQAYVLLCNTPGNELLHQEGSEGWRLKQSYPTSDEWNRRAVGFTFDDRGAKKFYEMTRDHINQAMAILLDDEVYSAPNIKSAISSSGIITGKYDADEVKRLVDTLNAGSLPARLTVVDTPSGRIAQPVAESTFGPTLGEENLRLAMKAGIIALIVIALFMTVYYLGAGFVAVFAMVVNLVFIMGAMCLLNAVFTLPGIAGIILSIGMAVDSNVLIYERLREEQAKGQSVRMALKNAYQHAFSAIFDSHVTTLLTCLILGWVGTEEVKGFAITLGLGMLFNLFTALTITRWIFQAMVDTGLVKRPFKMFHLIRVPSIKWMQKRYYFWGFSLATGVLGVASLFWTGHNIWGIEFTSGTQAIVQFKDDALLKDPSTGREELPNDGLVRSLFADKAHALGIAALEDARVEKQIDPDRTRNFMSEHFPPSAFPDVNSSGQITAQDWAKAKLNPEAFKLLARGANSITLSELGARLPANAYQVATTELNREKIERVVRDAFGTALVSHPQLSFAGPPTGRFAPMGIDLKAMTLDDLMADKASPAATQAAGEKSLIGVARITDAITRKASPFQNDLKDYEGGAVLVVQDINPPISTTDLLQRIRETRFQTGFADQAMDISTALPLGGKPGEETFSSFAVLVKPAEALGTAKDAWDKFARGEARLLAAALERGQDMTAQQFDAAIAGESARRALMAVVLSWVVIILYLWLRFGQAKWGLAAVLCLVHDVTIIVGLVAVSDWLGSTAIGQALMIQPFKIDSTMIAALLTIVGYSSSDTIVVFDRIRENRGKLLMLSEKVIDASVNQTLSRTLLTSGTVFAVVFIMYVWGGSGIHAFNYAFLAGVLFGTYSSIAVASPLLMGFKQAVLHRVAQDATA
ncbi:MAG: protein translocase subunit SecD [Phycisphaerae bacterium]